MKTIERYVFGSFLSSFLLAFLVLSFVLTIGLMVQIVGHILDGVPASLIGEFALVSFPETLQWTVPLALLVSSVLVFSRLSADSEVAAMRSCGINLLTVMKWPIIFALACAALGAWVNNEIVPRGHAVRRNLKTKVSVGTGLSMLEPGRWIDDFPKVKIYFGRKEGKWLYDLLVMDYSNPKVDRMFRASKALVEDEGRDVSLDLYDMTVDPLDADNRLMARVARYQYVMKDALKASSYTKKGKDFRFFELLGEISSAAPRERQSLERLYVLKHSGEDPEAARARYAGDASVRAEFEKDPEAKDLVRDSRRAASKLRVELSKRFVFSFASLCFVLVGIPLGIRAQRKESTVGMAISLAVALGYYLVVMLMLSMQKHYAIRPEFLMWLPVGACLLLAAFFTRKNL